MSKGIAEGDMPRTARFQVGIDADGNAWPVPRGQAEWAAFANQLENEGNSARVYLEMSNDRIVELERQRDEATTKCGQIGSKLVVAERERDEARAEVDILRAERNAEAAEVRRLQMELDGSCNAEELRQVRVEKERWRGAAELLRAALVEFGITPAERLGIAAYNKAKEEAK